MAPSPTIRRLLRETAELSASSSNPNPAFYAQPVSDSDLHEWHFVLLGPPAPSPYAGGTYHGRITLPSTYPLKPPSFRFLTPSGRFEVNREICLSISRFHEETWMPAWGVRTALTALRTFMTEQGSAGQVGGLEAPREVRERMARESRSWKCNSCRKSNREIIDQWWDVCRAKGIKIGNDGEEIGLDLLPEGMELEARDPKTKVESEPKADTPSQPPASQNTEQQSTSTSVESLPSSQGNPQSTARLSSVMSHVQRPTEGSSEQQVRNHVPTLSEPPQSSSSRTQQSQAATRDETNIVEVIAPGHTASTAGIDRAIGALVLALCLMILKKIFYPAQSSATLDDSFYLPDD